MGAEITRLRFTPPLPPLPDPPKGPDSLARTRTYLPAAVCGTLGISLSTRMWTSLNHILPEDVMKVQLYNLCDRLGRYGCLGVVGSEIEAASGATLVQALEVVKYLDRDVLVSSDVMDDIRAFVAGYSLGQGLRMGPTIAFLRDNLGMAELVDNIERAMPVTNHAGVVVAISLVCGVLVAQRVREGRAFNFLVDVVRTCPKLVVKQSRLATPLDVSADGSHLVRTLYVHFVASSPGLAEFAVKLIISRFETYGYLESVAVMLGERQSHPLCEQKADAEELCREAMATATDVETVRQMLGVFVWSPFHAPMALDRDTYQHLSGFHAKLCAIGLRVHLSTEVPVGKDIALVSSVLSKILYLAYSAIRYDENSQSSHVVRFCRLIFTAIQGSIE